MPIAITLDKYDAVLLDLDGVITDTASLRRCLGNRCSTGTCISARFEDLITVSY